MTVLNRDAVRELRRQLADVVALLSINEERLTRLVQHVRRQTATAADATANNVDEFQLSAADCGEWVVGRVLSALLADDDDDNVDDDGGEKKATSDVRGLLLAAGVDEATADRTVQALDWKVRRVGFVCARD